MRSYCERVGLTVAAMNFATAFGQGCFLRPGKLPSPSFLCPSRSLVAAVVKHRGIGVSEDWVERLPKRTPKCVGGTMMSHFLVMGLKRCS